MNRGTAVKQYVETMLTEKLDDFMRVHRFSRRQRNTVYGRKTEEGKQTIDIAYDVGPRYARNADAHLLPKLRILFSDVNEVALEMVAGNARMLGGGEVTLFEPIEMVAPKSETPRWLPTGQEGFLEAGEQIRSFIERWVIPFLDEYQTARAFVQGYERGDWRLLLMQAWYVYVAAAYIVLKEPEKARQVVTKKLGALGLRKQYSPVFDYFDQQR